MTTFGPKRTLRFDFQLKLKVSCQRWKNKLKFLLMKMQNQQLENLKELGAADDIGLYNFRGKYRE